MSQGYYLQALSGEIKRLLPAKCHKDFDAWMQQGRIELHPSNGGTGMQVARLAYQAVYLIEGLPFRELDPQLILAQVAAWLQDHDAHREAYRLGDPEYDVEPIDEKTADLAISVDFNEPLYLLPDDAGPIHYGGRRYQVAPYEVWVAETGVLWVNDSGPFPLGGDQ